MRHALATALLSMLICLPVFGQPSVREARVLRIATLYMADTAFAADSALVDVVMAVVQQRNEGMDPREWPQIRVEIAAALTELMVGKEGAVVVAFGSAMGGLSDTELVRLEQLLGDPVYRKFLRATASTPVQERLSQAVSQSLNSLNDLVDAVLARHGAKAAR